jgi:hypothetical protein
VIQARSEELTDSASYSSKLWRQVSADVAMAGRIPGAVGFNLASAGKDHNPAAASASASARRNPISAAGCLR